MKKKVFSREKYIASMRSNPLISDEYLQEIIDDSEHWSKKCDGLTSKEMADLWAGTMDDWMIEVDDGEI